MFESELIKLGLTEKEAKVYLAILALGPSTVIQIAQRADINRPTTYVQIENLMRRGLMSSQTKGKKTYFAAEPPDRLSELLRLKQAEFEDQNKRLKEILPELQNIFTAAEERPKVRFYEGKEGVMSMIKEDLKEGKGGEILNFYSEDFAKDFFTRSERDQIEQLRKNAGITSRSLYTRKKGPFKELPPPTVDDRFVPEDKFLFSASIDISEKRIAMHTMKGKIIGAIIESREMASMMRSLFELAWEAAEKYQKE